MVFGKSEELLTSTLADWKSQITRFKAHFWYLCMGVMDQNRDELEDDFSSLL